MGRNVAKGKANGLKIKKGAKRDEWRAATFNKTHPLIGALRRHLVSENRNENAERPHTRIHPSDMAKNPWCPRYSWYLISGKTPDRHEDVSDRLANIFAEGHSIHAKFQGWFWDMGILEGNFRCLDCRHEWWATSPTDCPHCGMERWGLVYAEVDVDIPSLFAIGHADGIVHINGKRAAIEIKSVSLRTVEIERPDLHAKFKDGTLDLLGLFRAIRMPFGSHLKQGLIYLHGFQNDERFADIDTIVFIYEFKANQEWRAWSIKYNADVIKPLVAGANAVQVAIEVGGRVKHPIWADPGHKVCSSCVFLKTCDP